MKTLLATVALAAVSPSQNSTVNICYGVCPPPILFDQSSRFPQLPLWAGGYIDTRWQSWGPAWLHISLASTAPTWCCIWPTLLTPEPALIDLTPAAYLGSVQMFNNVGQPIGLGLKLATLHIPQDPTLSGINIFFQGMEWDAGGIINPPSWHLTHNALQTIL